MTDIWAAFPDAQPSGAAGADPWAAFPDAGGPQPRDMGAGAAGALHWANQAVGGFAPQIAGAVQGVLDVTGIDQHRNEGDRAAPGYQQPQTVADLAAALGPGGPRPVQSIGSFGGGYDNYVNNANANLDLTAAQHPVASAVGDVGGAVTLASLIPAGKIAQGLGIAAKEGTMAATMGKAFAGGLGYGAISGAGNTRGGIGDRVQGGIEGAALNGAVGLGGPIVAKGLGAAASAAGRAIARPFRVLGSAKDPASEAARRAVGGWAADVGDPNRVVAGMEQAQKAGLPVMAADMGETSRALADSAAISSHEGRAILTKALDERHAGRLDRVISVIESAAPGINAPATRDFLEQAAKSVNNPAYKTAIREGDRPLWSPELERLTSSPDVVDAMRSAATKGKSRAVAEGFGAFNPAVKITPDGQVLFGKGKGGVPTYPNLQFWDYTKRALDDTAKELARKGRTGEAQVAGDLAKQLRTELDLHVPSYGKARAGAAAFFGAEDALTAGTNFITKQGADDFHGAAKALGNMSTAEKKLFAEGAATTLVTRLRNNPNLIDTIFLKSPAAKQRIELALGRGAAAKLEAVLRVEHLMGLTKYAVKGNSKTVQRLVGQLGFAGGVGAYSSGGDIYDPSTWLTGALTFGALRGGRVITARAEANVAREVAKLLASQNPQVVKQAIDRVSRSPRLMNALRIGEGHFSRVLAPVAGQVGRGPALPPGIQPANAQDRN